MRAATPLYFHRPLGDAIAAAQARAAARPWIVIQLDRILSFIVSGLKDDAYIH